MDLTGFQDIANIFIILSVAVFIAFILKNAFFLFLTYYQQGFVWAGRARLAEILFRHYLARPYAVHLRSNSAELLRNLTTSTHEIFAGVVMPLITLTTELLVSVVILAVLLVVDPTATILTTVVLGGCLAAVYGLIRRRLQRWGVESQATQLRILQTAQQALASLQEIKVRGAASFYAETFAAVMARNSTCRRNAQVITQLPRVTIEVLVIGAVLLGALAYLMQGRSLAEGVPVLGLFAVAAFRLMPSLNRIAMQFNSLRFNAAAVDVLHGDFLAAGALPAVPAPSSALTFAKSIVLNNISYHYAKEIADVLSGVSLRIERGQSIALVGPSGSGKSTLVAILMGLLEPSAGFIAVDDCRLDAATLPSWQSHLGYIPQDVFILDDTLRRNIAFGQADADIDEARVHRAISLATLDGLVSDLAHGLDTVLGDRGVRLSGGQRQRAGIARALYLDSDVLVLDEATSSLDVETESQITSAIERLRGDKTLIIVAHRLSTVQFCDIIFFLKDGRVVDRGSFFDLTARNADFRSMVDKLSLATGRIDR